MQCKISEVELETCNSYAIKMIYMYTLCVLLITHFVLLPECMYMGMFQICVILCVIVAPIPHAHSLYIPNFGLEINIQ